MKCTIDVAIVRLRSHCVGDVDGPSVLKGPATDRMCV